jgi:dTMP kinase
MFISFEGIEGAGKSTQARLVKEWLEKEKGRSVTLTREPGGTPVGDQVRQVLLRPGNEMEPETELLLLQASRRELCVKVISPALAEGRIVLVDRFADSSMAYQGYGRGLDLERCRRIIRFATGEVWPDLTILFDIDPELGLSRCKGIGKAEREGSSHDRMETESLDFFRRVREGYLKIASGEPDRFCVIPVTGGVEETFIHVREVLESRLPQGAKPARTV